MSQTPGRAWHPGDRNRAECKRANTVGGRAGDDTERHTQGSQGRIEEEVHQVQATPAVQDLGPCLPITLFSYLESGSLFASRKAENPCFWISEGGRNTAEEGTQREESGGLEQRPPTGGPPKVRRCAAGIWSAAVENS